MLGTGTGVGSYFFKGHLKREYNAGGLRAYINVCDLFVRAWITLKLLPIDAQLQKHFQYVLI